MKNKITIWMFLLFFSGIIASANGQKIEGKITEVSGNKVEINLGTLDGIVEDTFLEIYKKSKLVHPVTGEEIRTQKERIGVIRIDNADYEKSEGTLVSYQKNPKVGYNVEILIDDYEYRIGDKSVSSNGVVKDAGVKNAIISLGSEDNIEKGLIFDVYRNVPIENPQTGEQITTKPKKVGRLMAANVRETDTYCKVLDGDVKVGDDVKLADKQQGDISLEKYFYEQPQQVKEPQQKVKGIGRIYKIDEDGIHIYFDRLYNLKEGDLLSVYRQEKLTHPVTNKFLGEELIKVAEISLINVNRKEGTAEVISSDADIKVSDVVKVERLLGRKQISTLDETPVEKPKTTDETKQALNITKELINLQKEIFSLKSLVYRVNYIEEGLKEQKNLTASLQKDMNEIKDYIKYGTLEEKEGLGSGSEVAIIGDADSKENTFRVKYTDDVDLKFQLKNRTLMVDLDVDSSKFSNVRYESPDTISLLTEAGEEKAWYRNWFYWAIAAVIELLLILLLFIKVRKKKEKVEKAKLAEEETFEEEEELSPKTEEEAVGKAQEVVAEAEEGLEDIEELEEEEEILDDEAL